MASQGELTPICLIVPWMGNLPGWLPKFKERMKHQSAILLQIFRINTPEERAAFRRDIGEATAVYPPSELLPRKICDYRPAFGDIFEPVLESFSWWGWCDLDCVFGDMRAFLTEERLHEYDLITDNPDVVNGPFTILKNSARMCSLYKRHAAWRKVFASPRHVAFDEQHFTEIVKSSPDVHALMLSDAHTHDNESGAPSLREGKLYAEDGRELLTYHFPRAKSWPL